MRRNKRATTKLWLMCAAFASCAFAQDTTENDSVSWLPARCVPLETIGFHDTPEPDSDAVEAFNPVKFKSTPFTLRVNETLSELLADNADSQLFISMQMEESAEIFEFSCKEVLGANRELGFSCLNTPPSDILMLNPKSMRFSRAAIGSWTFQSDAALKDGSSLFVEMGQCYSLETDSDSS